MRQHAQLPVYACLRQDERGASVSFVCQCGEAQVQKTFAHLDETGSSAEVRCPKCHRYIQIRASREV